MARKLDKRPIVVVVPADRTSAPDKAHSPTGLSMYSRVSARGELTPRMTHAPLKARGHDHTKQQLVEITQSQIKKCEVDLRLAESPSQRANVLGMIAIKQRFITTLRAAIAEDPRP
jgi:hypothetical protein